MLVSSLRRMIAPGCLVYVLTPVDIQKGQYMGMHFNQWNFRKLNALFSGFEIVEWKQDSDYYVVYKRKEENPWN
jgi:predicted GNAT superfamily acetyltransferase